MNAIAPAPKIKRHRGKPPWPLPMRPWHVPPIQQGYKTTTLRRDPLQTGLYRLTPSGLVIVLTLDPAGPIIWTALTPAEQLALAHTEGYRSVEGFLAGTRGIAGIDGFLSGEVAYWRHFIRPAQPNELAQLTTAITTPAPEGTGNGNRESLSVGVGKGFPGPDFPSCRGSE